VSRRASPRRMTPRPLMQRASPRGPYAGCQAIGCARRATTTTTPARSIATSGCAVTVGSRAIGCARRATTTITAAVTFAPAVGRNRTVFEIGELETSVPSPLPASSPSPASSPASSPSLSPSPASSPSLSLSSSHDQRRRHDHRHRTIITIAIHHRHDHRHARRCYHRRTLYHRN
jgi:hypothetical protein